MTEKDTKPQVEEESPPPLPPKPKKKGEGRLIFGISVLAVAAIALLAGSLKQLMILRFESYNPPITWENYLADLLNDYYLGPPATSTLADLVGVETLSVSQKSKLRSFREKHARAPIYNLIENENVIQLRFDINRTANRTDVPEGSRLSLTVYKPKAIVRAEKLTNIQDLPSLVYFHGGSFVAGSPNDTWAQDLAESVPCLVVSVDYALAPEYTFNSSVQDGVDATFWLMDHFSELQVDPDRFGLVGTEAGSTLAAAVATNLRDRGFKHSIRVLGLAAPLLTRPAAAFKSYANNRQTWESDDTAWDLYTGKVTKDERTSCRLNTNCSPFHVRSFEHLPPLLLFLPEHDARRSAAGDFYQRYLDSGEFVQFVMGNSTTNGALQRLDVNDTAFLKFSDYLFKGFFPPESPLEMAMRKAREYAEIYG